MAHYAFLDENNIVTSVIVGKDEGTDGIDWEQKYGEIKGQTCKRTSYNTINNVHILDGTPFRGNYAGIGYVYDDVNDIFIPVKPYDSWSLDIATATWKAPVDMPTVEQRTWTDGEGNTRGLPADWNDDLIRWESYKDAQKVYWDPDTSTWINAT